LRIARTIEGVLRWQEGLKENAINNIGDYRARFAKLLEGSPPIDVVLGDAIIFEAEARLHGSERIEEELNDLLRTMNEEILQEKFTTKMAELKQAENKGDVPLAEKLLTECQSISKELHTLTKNTL
ncbi:MAG TPA: hypothetical protein DCZ83_01980, partial [Candidatus Yonathbacteria bacterium]|nr:hypothetical protein [Candidatus Yonathbacteria bacterium]